MDDKALHRLIEQITTLFVEPEIKKSNFGEKIFAVFNTFSRELTIPS
jgi:hypothetical protein